MAERHVCDIFPPRRDDPTSYFGSQNVEITPDGMTPSFDHGEISSGSGDKGHYWLAPIETKAPNGNPRQYIAVNDKVFRYEDDALTLDVDFNSADAVIQGMVIIDDNQTPRNKRLVAFFGDGTGVGASGGHAWRNLGSDSGGGFSGAWTKHTGATAVQGWLATRCGPDVYLVTGSSGAGRTTLGENKVAKIPSGTWDGTTTNIGPGEPVGNADWPVIALTALEKAVVAGKGDGAYYRDTVDKVYAPLRPLQERLPHGLNTKGMAPSENGVLIPTSDGRLFEYDSATTRDVTPNKDVPKPKDTQRGRISFVADRGDVVAVGYEVAAPVLKGPRAAALGVRVFTRVGGGPTYTEITSGVTDGSLVTPASANMNGWGGNANDRLIITSPVPLAGFIPRVTRQPNAAANTFATPEVSDGAGGFTSLGNIIDLTQLQTATASLKLIGFPPAASEPIVGWDSKSAYYDAQLDAITLGGLGTISTVYVYQVRPSTTTGMTSTTTIDEMDFVLGRPGLRLDDPDGPFVAANDFTSLINEGMLTEIYFGRRHGFGEYEWSNPYTLATKGGGIFTAGWTTTATGAMTNGGQALVLYGRKAQYVIAEGETRDPRRTRYPRLCQWTATEPGPRMRLNNIVFRQSDGRVADPTRPKRILGFELMGRDLAPEDHVQIWADYLAGRGPFKCGGAQGPSPITVTRRGGETAAGYRATVDLLYADMAQTDAWAPLVERVAMTWEYADDARVEDARPEAARAVD